MIPGFTLDPRAKLHHKMLLKQIVSRDGAQTGFVMKGSGLCPGAFVPWSKLPLKL